jgi:hypothetical protein
MAKRKAKAKRRAAPRITVMNLKGKSPARMKTLLQQASRSRVFLVVKNAPFKLCATEAVAEA